MRNWTELAISLNSDSCQLARGAVESMRGARFAAAQARAGIPWPGETIATLVLIDVMAEAETVEAGRCC